MDDLEIRDVRLEEARKVGELFHIYWRQNHIFFRNPKVLIWQYYKNPYSRLFTDDLSLKGAYFQNQLIGVEGYIPFVFNLYGRHEYGCHLCNWFVLPQYRAGGCALQILGAIMNQSHFSAFFTFDLTDIARSFYKTLKFMIIENLFPTYVVLLSKERMRNIL